MTLKKLKKYFFSLFVLILLLNLFTLDKNSKIFIVLKKNFTGIYHFLGFDDPLISQEIISQKSSKSFSETVTANSFDIEVFYSKDLKFAGKSAGIYIDNQDNLLFYDQKGYLINKNKITKLDLTPSFTTEYQGGLKGIFFIEDKAFGFISSRTINCYKSSLISIKSKTIIFETACLPDDHLIDYNGIGGANLILDENVYISIGAPEATSQLIRNLSQDKSSYYGKILKLDKKEVYNEKVKDVEIFSFGHRNPQGLINYDNKILSTEHGPYGGDEINIIAKDNNYGWPVTSYGTKYHKNDADENERGSGESFSFNHNESGFIEPLYTFIPSEAISDLTECPKNLKEYYSKPCLLLSSLKAGSLFVVILEDDMSRVISIEKINIGLRIRHFAKKLNSTSYDRKNHVFVSADTEGILKIVFNNFR